MRTHCLWVLCKHCSVKLGFKCMEHCKANWWNSVGFIGEPFAWDSAKSLVFLGSEPRLLLFDPSNLCHKRLTQLHYLNTTIYCQLQICCFWTEDPNPTPLVITFEVVVSSSCLLQLFSQLLAFNTLKVTQLCSLPNLLGFANTYSSFPSAGMASIVSTSCGVGQKVSLGDLPRSQASGRVPHSSASVHFGGLLHRNKEQHKQITCLNVSEVIFSRYCNASGMEGILCCAMKGCSNTALCGPFNLRPFPLKLRCMLLCKVLFKILMYLLVVLLCLGISSCFPYTWLRYLFLQCFAFCYVVLRLGNKAKVTRFLHTWIIISTFIFASTSDSFP